LALMTERPAWRGRQMLIMPFIEGPTLQQFIGEVDDRAARLRVAEAVGRQLCHMLYAGLVNRDHKTSNLIVDEACRLRGEQPVLIDPAGLRRATPERVARMFARLLETAIKAGPISKREMLSVLRSAFPGRPAEELRRERRAISAAYRRMNGPPL
jgi:tRNA A-37 threonylcarbamoyl transferase component Bud32